MNRTSHRETANKYLKGFSFWSQNAFWRCGLYSVDVQKKYEQWLSDMRTNEKHLTKLEASVGNGVRV